jgi:hypothetical protein
MKTKAAQPTSVRWRIGVLIALAVGFSILGHFISHSSSGIVSKLDHTKVCISNVTPRGRSPGCWRVDANTDVDAGVARGDLVTVRFRGNLALSVDEDVPPGR